MDDASKSMNHLTVIVYLDTKQKPENAAYHFIYNVVTTKGSHVYILS